MKKSKGTRVKFEEEVVLPVIYGAILMIFWTVAAQRQLMERTDAEK